jgi:hypothetical protein
MAADAGARFYGEGFWPTAACELGNTFPTTFAIRIHYND